MEQDRADLIEEVVMKIDNEAYDHNLCNIETLLTELAEQCQKAETILRKYLKEA
ncbi:MAG: hypothetical protein GY941_22345 [Planctomycetes bacterium]|nr:hypothetical protein [Planctomycetota bacterium]